MDTLPDRANLDHLRKQAKDLLRRCRAHDPVNEPTGVDDPDWSGCARALVAHGLPRAERGRSDPETVLIDGRSLPFSDDVTEVLTAARTPPGSG